jgi:hypothetical protein
VRRLEIGWTEGNGTNTRLCSLIGFDGVVAERLLAGKGGRDPLDLRNGRGPPCRAQGTTSLQTGGDVPLPLPLPPFCHCSALEILWVGALEAGGEAGGEADLVCFCRGYQYLEIIQGCNLQAQRQWGP